MTRQKVIITGAGGGMGRACARLFANAHDVVLTDLESQPFDMFVEELRDDGYSVEAYAGDLSSDIVLAALADSCDGRPFTLIHTAGIGPSQGDWRTIMRVDLIAVEMLLRHSDRKKPRPPEHRIFDVRLVERQSCMARPS